MSKKDAEAPLKQLEEVLPMPVDPAQTSDKSDCRLWVGNLDPRITEFAIMKLLQKQGPLEKFDFIYHKTGPEAGKARGYCFATYETPEIAEKAKTALNGKLALSKRLVVKEANADRKEEFLTKFTVNTVKESKPKSLLNKDMQIRAIEAKLKVMESTKDDTSASTSQRYSQPGYRHYQGQSQDQSSRSHSTSQRRGSWKRQPYNRR